MKVAGLLITLIANAVCCYARDEDIRKLIVLGTGQREQAPDVATLNLKISEKATKVQTALKHMNERMSDLIESIKATSLYQAGNVKLSTSMLSATTETKWSQTQGSYDDGYRASETLYVVLTNKTDDVGSLIDAAMNSNGAPSFEGVVFTVKDRNPLYEAAAEDAVADANRKARLAVTAAGEDSSTLRPYNIDFTRTASIGPMVPQFRAKAVEMSADVSPTSVVANTEVIQASVRIEYTFTIAENTTGTPEKLIDHDDQPDRDGDDVADQVDQDSEILSSRRVRASDTDPDQN